MERGEGRWPGFVGIPSSGDSRGCRHRSGRPYQLHQDIERMLEWMGPITDLPPKLG